MRKFGRTYQHGTAFPREECLNQKEATGMDTPKMYCSSRWKNPTNLCGSANFRFIRGSIVLRMEICKISGLLISMLPLLHQSNGYIKRNMWVWRAQKCIALFGAETVLTTAGPQSTSFHVGQYRADNRNIRKFGPTNPHGTTFPPKQWLYQ